MTPDTATVLAPPPQPRPTSRAIVPRLLMVLAGAVTGIGGGFLIGKWLKHTGSDMDLSMVDLLALPVAWWVSVLVHETGHAWAGVRTGFHFIFLTAGPLRVAREDQRLKLRFNDQASLWGGLTLLVPVHMERFHERARLMVAGGPLASLALALAAAALSLAYDGHARFWALALAAMSGSITIATLIPNEIGGYASDGAQLLALGRRAPVAEARALLAMVAGTSVAGTRPRDYDAHLVARIQSIAGPPSLRLAAAMLKGLRALDRGESAAEFFALIPEGFLEVPAGMRQGYAVWLVWYHAVERGDVALAEQWSKAAQGGLVDPAMRALADASLAFAQRDPMAARAAIVRGLQGPAGIDAGAAMLVRDLLRALEGRLAEAEV